MLFELARKTPSWRKVELIGEMRRTVCDLALSGLRERYPQVSAKELRRRLAEILLGSKLASRAYGPFLETEECYQNLPPLRSR